MKTRNNVRTCAHPDDADLLMEDYDHADQIERAQRVARRERARVAENQESAG